MASPAGPSRRAPGRADLAAEGAPAAIRARDLAFTYGGASRPTLRDVSFELGPGEALLIVGASGSGKSTLGRAIAGLVPGDFPGEWSGTLRVGDLDLPTTARAALAGVVGMVFQDPGSQLIMDRVEDDVAFGLENRAWPVGAMRARVPDVLAQVGLAGLGRRRPNTLSGGQQQRLALAGVLAARPGVLVLDEPTANLDPDGTHAVFGLLHEIRERRLATIVLIEHRVEAAWPLADRVLALGRDGSPIDFGTPDDVVARSGERLRAEGIWLPRAVDAALPLLPTALPLLPTAPGAEVRDWSGGALAAASPVAAGVPLVLAGEVIFGYTPHEPIVRQATLAVRAGERVVLVGPNGSGKSTLGRLLVGLLRPWYGWVRLAGRDPASLPARALARDAGYIFQDPELGFIAERVIDEVRAGLPAARVGDADAMLERLGLPPAEFGQRSPYRLSGGEARRLSLAATLVRRPSLLVLDEPTYGQDRRGYEALLEILRERIDDGAAVIAATHDERLVADFANRRIEMAEGWIVADEPVAVASGRDATAHQRQAVIEGPAVAGARAGGPDGS